jgi:glutathione-independent formaldehyde dehydrogenase
MLTDILPTGFQVGRCEGWFSRISQVWASRSSVCLKLSIIRCSYCIVGDLNEERLAHARSFGCETINLTNGIPVQEQIAMIVVPEVDCFVDCVGFEARARCGRRKESRLLF